MYVFISELCVSISFRFIYVLFSLSAARPQVPAQPSKFEAEAELDSRILLTWLWPVQDPIIKYELRYWEAGTDNKVRISTGIYLFFNLLCLFHTPCMMYGEKPLPKCCFSLDAAEGIDLSST